MRTTLLPMLSVGKETQLIDSATKVDHGGGVCLRFSFAVLGQTCTH